MSGEKIEWSVQIEGTVHNTEFESSSTEGKRSVLSISVEGKYFFRLRLTRAVFHHLMEKMKGHWELREEFTEADGLELHRWLRFRRIKIRVQKVLGSNRTLVSFVEFLY